jgi:glycerate kinase
MNSFSATFPSCAIQKRGKSTLNMALRILVVPDKFKGTLTAMQAAQAIASGWIATRPYDFIEMLPMADGGEGFGEIIGHLLNAQRKECLTIDSAGHTRSATWWFAPTKQAAIVETAQANGLALLPSNQYHPFELDTFGIGALLKAATRAGARRIYLGLGGSATNDGGFGLARALGWTFWNSCGAELRAWTELLELTRVQAPAQGLPTTTELVIAVDVTNPLLGPSGATRVYGPQKGLRESDLRRAEDCLTRLAHVTEQLLQHDYATEPGSGAAGGLGFAFRAFCGGKFQPGAEVFAALSGLAQRIDNADLIVTGEGAFDHQSLMGKGVGTVAQACACAGKRCLCLAGSVCIEPMDIQDEGFRAYSIVPTIADLEYAKLHASECLRQLATRVAREV